MRAAAFVLALCALLPLARAQAAPRHVTATPNTAQRGGRAVIYLRVPHGCDGAPTRSVTAVIPFNVTSVKPRRQPGWSISTTLRPLVPPVTSEGGALINTTVDTVTWTAEPGLELLDSQFEDFGLLVRLPTTAAGDAVYFPTTQNCTNGEQAFWTDTGNGQGEAAPRVNLTDASSRRSLEAGVSSVVSARHVSATPSSATRGSRAVVAFRVPHGCDGAATTSLTVVVPFNVTSVLPRRNHGWTVSTTLRPLVPPVTDSHGVVTNTTIDTVTWTATPGNALPDDIFDEFELLVRLPTAAAGNIVYFPTTQNCTNGQQALWTNTGSGTGEPAPSVNLTDAPAKRHVTANPSTGTRGGRAVIDFRVPHGCDGASTESVTVVVPFNVTSVKPRPLAGWTVSSTLRPLVPPVSGEGGAVINTTVDTVTWTADRGAALPDGFFEDFSLYLRLPTAAAGDAVYFPTTQNCTGGSQAFWTNTGNGDGESAPRVNLTDSTAAQVTTSAVATTTRPSGAGARAAGMLWMGAAAAAALAVL
ncbi:hypothetical protein DFJ74DRAFT_691102 [Hyaloraphidium curvatum]|nr:hypothetical protein DFJ74DRAFT_691102 [Hyaloraphidium curvatum]